MPRFKLTIEYAGTRYSGWQIQKNARTVQGEIDRAVREATGRKEFELYGSGRTDAGVHALAQVAHLELYTSLAAELLRRKINDALPADIHVRTLDKVAHRFHARHDAISRSYLYQISRRRTAFAKPFVWWIREPLDVEAMRRTAEAFVGRKDFAAFSDDDPDEKSTVVVLEQITIDEAGALVLIRVQGSHFLWKMVRRIVGVLAAVGRHEIRPDSAATLLDSNARSQAVNPAALSAPAAGLFLEHVRYPGDPPTGPLRPLIAIAN
jgi:tRNA pseudouridine38-40 synthase